MTLRHAAALALVTLVGCGPDMTIVDTATQRAEASAKRAEISAAKAESAANQAAKSANEAVAAADVALDAVRRANDFEVRIEAGASCSHGWEDFAGEINTCKPLSAADVKWINSRVKQLALVGWYLIQPPPVAGPGRVDQSAPISRWSFFNGRHDPDTKGEKLNARLFGSEVECTAEVSRRRGFWRKYAEVLRRDVTFQLALWNDSTCISANDPRLPGN